MRSARTSPRDRGRTICLCSLLLAAGMLVAACGTRVTDDEIIAAAGGQEPSATQVGLGVAGPSAPGSAEGEVPTGFDGTPGAPTAAAPTSRDDASPSAEAAGGGQAPVPGEAPPAGSAAAAETCTSAGEPVIIGQVASASGIVGQNNGDAVPVAQVWAQHMNEKFGGLACHPIRFISKDDGSDPGRAASAVAELKQQGAQALISNIVPLSFSGFHSGVDKAKIPAIGGDLSDLPWWEDPLLYPVGTSIEAVSYGTMATVAEHGFKKVAVLYCVEAAACPTFAAAVRTHAGKQGAKVVYESSVSLAAPDYTSQCQNARNAGADQITLIMDGAGISRLARSCLAINYNVPFAAQALGANFDTSDPNVRKVTVSIAGFGAPWVDPSTPGQEEMLTALRTYAPSLRLDATAPSAWIGGMMLKAAVDKLGAEARDNPLTTDLIVKGLSMIKNETLDGMVGPTTFTGPTEPNPRNPCFFPVKFTSDGKWTAPFKAEYRCM